MKGWKDIGIRFPERSAFLVLVGILLFLSGSRTSMAQTLDCVSGNSDTLCSICGDGICAPGEICPDDCPPSICGDSICEEGEACVDDCGDSCELLCGDFICSADEDALSCPEDCGAVCGDQLCAPGEDCPEDCGACQPTCGDGDIEPDEDCDDGNGDSGDGCDSACLIEDNYECGGEPSLCVTDCLPEICDDSVDNDCDHLSDCADPDCDQVPCSPGDACRAGGICSGGACEAGEVLSCEDNDACTEDSCDPVDGCRHGEIPGCGAASPIPTPVSPPDDDGASGERPDDPSVTEGEGWSCALGGQGQGDTRSFASLGGLLLAAAGLRLRLKKH